MIKPKCPRCVEDLERERLDGHQFYRCLSCNGSSFTFSSLKHFVEPTVLTRLWSNSQFKEDNPNTICPLCLNPMKTLLAPTGDQVELDVCRYCKIVWFDERETEVLPTLLAKGKKTLLIPSKEKSKDDLNLKSPHVTAYLSILGLPAEKFQHKLKSFPYITWSLIVMVSVISIQGFGHRELVNALGFYTAPTFRYDLLKYLSHFFVHSDIWHLLGNMYFLWVFGDNSEDDLGKVNYLLLIAASNIFSVIIFLFTIEGNHLLIGASGGIAGILGYYLVRFPQRKFYLFFFFKFFTIPAYYFGVLYFAKEFYGLYLQLNSFTNVSHICHLAGAFVGMGLGLYKRKFS